MNVGLRRGLVQRVVGLGLTRQPENPQAAYCEISGGRSAATAITSKRVALR